MAGKLIYVSLDATQMMALRAEMSLVEFGAYHAIAYLQWLEGPLPEARAKHIACAAWESICWRFKSENGFVWIEWLKEDFDRILKKQQHLSEEGRKAIQKRWSKPRKTKVTNRSPKGNPKVDDRFGYSKGEGEGDCKSERERNGEQIQPPENPPQIPATNPPVDKFRQGTDYFVSKWSERYGQDYPFTKADGTQYAAMFKKFGFDGWCALVDSYFSMSDKLIDDNGHPLKLMSSKLSAIVANINGKAVSSKALKTMQAIKDWESAHGI